MYLFKQTVYQSVFLTTRIVWLMMNAVLLLMQQVYRSWRSLFSRLLPSLTRAHRLFNRATVASFVDRCGTAALLRNTSRTRNHACARALHVLSVQLERGESVRRDWISRCASVSPRSAGGTVTGRHETECGQRLKPVTQSQRPILACAALSVCVLCFL